METTPSRSNWIPGLVAVVAVGMFLAFLIVPIVLRAQRAFYKWDCLQSLKELGTALSMYESDWGGRFPPLKTTGQQATHGKTWVDKALPYARNKGITRCPSTPDRLTYSFNSRLAGVRYRDVRGPEGVLMVFESVNDSPRNNNLNGGSMWHPSAGDLPTPGAYIEWPQDAKRLWRRWPKWAHPNHADATMVVLADGHARVVPWDPESEWAYKARLSPK